MTKVTCDISGHAWDDSCPGLTDMQKQIVNDIIDAWYLQNNKIVRDFRLSIAVFAGMAEDLRTKICGKE